MTSFYWDDNYPYQADGYTDTNEYFVVAVVGGLSNVLWRVEVGSDTPSGNHIFPQPSFNRSGGTNIGADEAALVSFTALLATSQIRGSVTDAPNHEPIAGVGVHAHAPNINGLSYGAQTETDEDGHTRCPPSTGPGYVGLSCSGGDDSLESLGFQCVDQQATNILNSDAVVNFMAGTAS